MSCSRDFPPTNCKQCLIFLLLLLLLFFGTRSAQRRLQNFQRMECNRTKGNYLTLLVIQHCSDLLNFFFSFSDELSRQYGEYRLY